jgi:hypothetical protein
VEVRGSIAVFGALAVASCGSSPAANDLAMGDLAVADLAASDFLGPDLALADLFGATDGGCIGLQGPTQLFENTCQMGENGIYCFYEAPPQQLF